MANVLSFQARVAVIAHLVQGTSIRATAKLCEVDKDAVMRLGVIVGLACLVLHDRLMTGVRSALLEVDEVWAYVGRHDRRRLAKDPPEFGDHYTMFAIDPVSKLVPSFLTGRRNPDTARPRSSPMRAIFFRTSILSSSRAVRSFASAVSSSETSALIGQMLRSMSKASRTALPTPA